MAEEKVFTNEVIEPNPYPGGIESVFTLGSQPKDTFAPTTTSEKTFPKKRVAVELLSTALNTRSRKILENFELQQSGGFQVGDFKKGISGDLKITPNGITARDITGLTTFAIDGSDGSAVFAGEIRSGSLVSGQVKVGDNRIIIDGNTQTIIVNDGANDRILIGRQDGGF